LKNLGKNQSWLAEEIGVTRQSVSLYVKGRSVPKDDLLQKLYSSLDVQYGILDDLLEDFDNE
jgi:transcriptional regulator with XRE-family HTH domain